MFEDIDVYDLLVKYCARSGHSTYPYIYYRPVSNTAFKYEATLLLCPKGTEYVVKDYTCEQAVEGALIKAAQAVGIYTKVDAAQKLMYKLTRQLAPSERLELARRFTY